MLFKKKVIVILSIMLLVFTSINIYARDDDSKENHNGFKNQNFKDVPENYWAYDSIMLMSDYQIINGYNDRTFKPEAPVTRAEFAKMMVLVMQLDLINPSNSDFIDVSKDNWAYKYIETAKSYMTGFSTSMGLYFKPAENAQREDMAVAIVKGLGIDPTATSLNVLNNINDQANISKNLRSYVAAAINNGIMIGDDNKNFNPKATLRRAEAATLLARLITEEKVVFDEEKVVLDDSSQGTTSNQTPQVSATTQDDKIILHWTGMDATDFLYYKVVLSKSDSTPSYPDNGYAAVITSSTTTGYELEAGDSYNGGDLGGTIKAGQTYYAAITAVYNDKKITGNVITITIPENDNDEESYIRTPILSKAVAYESGLKLNWTKCDVNNFKYYKVVLSKYNEAPSYPDDGYVTYITDINDTDFVIKEGQAYQGGDIGGTLESERKYYVSITAVYGNNPTYNTSNVITVTLP